MNHWHREKACDILAYIKNKSIPRIEPCGTPLDMDTGSEKLLLKLTKNDLLKKQNLNQTTACFKKPIAYNS